MNIDWDSVHNIELFLIERCSQSTYLMFSLANLERLATDQTSIPKVQSIVHFLTAKILAMILELCI